MTNKRRLSDGDTAKRGGKARKSAEPGKGTGLRLMAAKPRRFWLIASMVILVAAAFSVGYYRAAGGPGYPLDDTWIHLTFARNVASGLGFGANPHEPTPGATSPLWVLLLAPGFLFGAVHGTWPWILATLALCAAGILSSALIVALVRKTTGNAGNPEVWVGLLGGVTVVWVAPLVWSAAGALEVPLFVATICATLLAFTVRPTGNWRTGVIWGVLAGLASLARPEGLLLAPILALVTLWRLNRGAVIEAAAGLFACGVVYLPSVVFCLATSGFVFPNTFYAKTTALVAGMPDREFLSGTLAVVYEISPVGLLAFFLGVVGTVVAVWRRCDSRGVLATAAFAVGLPLAYAAMGRTLFFAPFAGNFGRYLYPVVPVALVLGFWAVGYAMVVFRRNGAVALVGVALIVLAPLISIVGTVKRVELYRQNVIDVNTMQVAMANKLRDKLPPGVLVAANDVGALAYFTKFRVLDLIGIISTQTLVALERAGSEPAALTDAHVSLLRQEQPDALVVFPEWYTGTLRRLGRVAQPIEVITHEENITSPFPRLVAFRLDWRGH